MNNNKHPQCGKIFLAIIVIGLVILLSCFLLSPKEKIYLRDLKYPLQTKKFSIVSYNIQARPVLDPCDQKTPLIGELLNAYDLIGVQEAFSSYEKIFKKASLLQGVAFTKRRHPLKLVNSGLAILTRFLIIDIDPNILKKKGH